MTLPNGPAGITRGPLQEATSIFGASGDIARAGTFDQPAAEDLLKKMFVLDNGSFNDILAQIFSGLRQGISLPLAILEGVAKRLLGLPDDAMFFNVDHVLSALKKVPLLSDIIELFTGKEDGDESDLASWVRKLLSGQLIPQHTGNLTDEVPNIMPFPTFPAGSVNAGNGISEDVSTSRTGDGTGSLKIVLDGSVKTVVTGSNPTDTFPLIAGKTFTATVFCSHTSYVGSGSPVRLELIPFTAGVKGTPITLATYAPSAGGLAWPGEAITGQAEVPEGVDAGQFRIYVEASAASGTLWFDDGTMGTTGPVPDSIQNMAQGFVQVLIDGLYNVINDANVFGVNFGELLESLKNFDPAKVGGVGGAGSMLATILGLFNAIVGGAVGQQGTGATEADVFNFVKVMSTRASQGMNSWEVLGIRNNTSAAFGQLPSSESNYLHTLANTDIPVTQAASVMSWIRVERGAPLGLVSWIGHGVTGIDALHVKVWKVNGATVECAHVSPNILGDMDAGVSPIPWQFYFLLPDELVARRPGEDYLYEIVVIGAGTHYVRGFVTDDDIADHPYSSLVAQAATRNNTSSPLSTASFPKSSLVRSNNIAFIETAIDSGNTVDIRDPILHPLVAATTLPIPNWCKYVDVVGCGEGGDGSDGASLGIGGKAGEPGQFNAVRWERDVDFSGTDTLVDFDPESTDLLSIPGHVLTVVDGADATGLGGFGVKPIGRGSSGITFNGEFYPGGQDQTAWGGAGSPPGGAGMGGHYLTGFLTGGGKGGPRAGWVKFWPGTSEAGETEPDTTPPEPPTSVLVTDVTYSGFTITPTGGIDP